MRHDIFYVLLNRTQNPLCVLHIWILIAYLYKCGRDFNVKTNNCVSSSGRFPSETKNFPTNANSIARSKKTIANQLFITAKSLYP